MKKILALTFILSTIVYGRVANDTYRMPGSGNLPEWGKLSGASLVPNIDLPAVAKANGGFIILTGNANNSENLVISRGRCGFSGGAVAGYGQGYSCAHNSTGNYTVTMTTTFSGTPTVTATPAGALSQLINIVTTTNSTFNAIVKDTTGSAADGAFNFIAAAPR